MTLKKNTKRTIIILSSLAAVIIIGIVSGIITYVPITKSKNNTFGKSDKCFEKLKNKPYSYNRVEKILDQIENIALRDEYESINASVQTNIVENNKLIFIVSLEFTILSITFLIFFAYEQASRKSLSYLAKFCSFCS